MLFSKKIKYAWRQGVKETITSQTVISADAILFGTQSGNLYCMDMQGGVNWKYSTSPNISEKEALFIDAEEINSVIGKPLVYAEHIYVGTESGELHCVDLQGNRVWKQKVDGAIRTSPQIIMQNEEPIIIVGTYSGSLYFFDTIGRAKKIIKIHSPISTRVECINNVYYMGCDDGKIIACSEKGLHLWTYQTQGKVTADILVCELFSDGEKSLIIGSQDNILYSLSIDGELQWKFATNGAIIAPACAVHLSNNESKDILIGSCDNSMYCVNAHGEKLWSYETDFWITSSPVLIQKNGLYKICVGSYDQKLYVFDGESDFTLSYMPGLAGIINQTGYSSVTTSQDVGENTAKKLFEVEVEGHIISCATIPNTSKVIVSTKQGHMYEFSL